ncbi:MAG TPA: DUF11 domain-containing protein [Verrucomicrobiales bacterium]|nr:DUF11 domain-containing protein [Verrucomicrobiales bacterium]
MPEQNQPARFLPALALITCLTGLCTGVSIGNAQKPPTGSIHGIITGSLSGMGLENTQISVGDLFGNTIASSSSDSSGAFQVTSIPIGSYLVSFTLDGYREELRTLQLTSIASLELPISLQAIVATGVVLDSSDLPIANARILIQDNSGNEVATETTNSKGAFLVSGLPDGNYNFMVEANGFLPKSESLSLLQAVPTEITFQLNDAPRNQADLSVSYEPLSQPAISGQLFEFRILIKNDGPDSASDVSLVNNLPGNVAFVSAVSSIGSCARFGTLMTCSLGILEAGESQTLTITLAPDSPGSIENLVTIFSSTDDSSSDNNESTLRIDIIPPATDLGLVGEFLSQGALLPTGSSLKSGEPFTAKLSLSNGGPLTATDIKMVTQLNQNVVFSNLEPTDGVDCAVSGQELACTVSDLAQGGTMDFTLNFETVGDGTIDLAFEVSSSLPDPNIENNTASWSLVLLPLTGDLLLNIQTDTLTVSPGAQIKYQIKITNQGPDTATDLTIINVLPSGALASFDSATASMENTVLENQGDGAGGVSVVNVSLAQLLPGESETIDINLALKNDAAGSLIFFALARSTVFDPTPDNSTTIITPIVGGPTPPPAEPSAPIIRNPEIQEDGTFKFDVEADSGSSVTIQFSSNLLIWSDLKTLTLDGTNSRVVVDNSENEFSRRYYRALIASP